MPPEFGPSVRFASGAQGHRARSWWPQFYHGVAFSSETDTSSLLLGSSPRGLLIPIGFSSNGCAFSASTPGKRVCWLRLLRQIERTRGLRSHSPVSQLFCLHVLADAITPGLPCPRSIEGTTTVRHPWDLSLRPSLVVGLPRPTEWSCPVLSIPMPLNRVRSVTVIQPRRPYPRELVVLTRCSFGGRGFSARTTAPRLHMPFGYSANISARMASTSV
jgi:hypothetical protein